jgi:hypothetical protein
LPRSTSRNLSKAQEIFVHGEETSTARRRWANEGHPDMAKRELIDTGTDKRYVRRDSKGQFKESDDVGKSLAADRRTKAKTTSATGQGDRGDRQKS